MANSYEFIEMIRYIHGLDNRFRRSCEQITILNNMIEDMQSRFDCAVACRQRTFSYNIRLRLATLEGVRNMFHEYALLVADRLESLQGTLSNVAAHGDADSDDTEGEADDEDSDSDEA